MFLHPEQAWMLAKQRHHDDLEMAAKMRIVRMALQRSESEANWLLYIIWQFGHWMVIMGSRLQQYNQPVKTYAIYDCDPLVKR